VPELFWTLLKIGGYTLIAWFVLGVALIAATLALGVVWFVRDARRQRAQAKAMDRDNAELHEAIRLYLRQQLTAQE
jgi:hypothetical protein